MIIGLIVTGCLLTITYYLVTVLSELAERLKESKSVVSNLDEMTTGLLESQKKVSNAVNSVESITKNFEESISSLRNQIVIPFTYIMTFVQKLQEYFVSKKDEEDVDTKE